MSLLVNVYTRDPNGKMTFIDPAHPSEELAGFESSRQRLNGSPAARQLGLRLLPALDGGDVYAEGEEDVERLRAEAELALANVELFVEEAGASAERLRPRFENIIAAARRAASLGGGVVIW
jgi:hypothetical protein